MKIRKIVIGAVLVIIGLPVLLVLIVVVSVSVLNRTNGTIVSSGQKRTYLLYVPRSYDRAKPTPLVISMHPAATWPAAQMEISQWNKVADEHGFIVVYPSGGGGTAVLPKVWHLRPEAVLMANVSRGWNRVGCSRPTAVQLVCRLPTGADDQLSWNSRSCSVQRR